MAQITVASRLIECYSKQRQTIQALIMNQVPPALREDLIESALRKIGHR